MTWGRVGAAWGIAGVVVLLSTAVARLSPLAIEALRSGLSPLQWGALGASVATFAYGNGYRVFQRQWSPRIVARARALALDPTPARVAFAPFFCMAYFGATGKRKAIAWGVTLGVVILVVLVHRLPQPWRGIVDAGVVVGLSWAVLAIAWFALRAFQGHPLPVSPDLGD